MPTIPNAPEGQKGSVDGTEKVPVDGSFFIIISQVAEYIRTLAQTLTNKTLTTPTIGDFTNAQHDHAGPASGGGPIASYTIPRTVVDGLTLSNNGSDANNDIDIAAGQAVDDGLTDNMILAAALTKRLDANWAVGTNQGGLDTGAEANSTWYHVWLIMRPDTGVVDVLFSLSATAPTMPANYTKKRRIGAIKNDSSGNILPFLQYGDEFIWTSPPAVDVGVTNLSTSRVDYTLPSVPTGVIVKVAFNVRIGGAASRLVYVSNPSLVDLAPSATVTPLAQIDSIGTNNCVMTMQVYTNISAQISARSSGTSTDFFVAVLGWVDPRGKR